MTTYCLRKFLRKPSCLLIVLSLLCWLASAASAQMQSESLQLNTSVISGGGTPPAASANFSLNGTTGQPSPLMEPDDPPESPSYALQPGFWYTLDAMPSVCDDVLAFAAAYGSLAGDGNYNAACDQEGDGDVDGEDLAMVAASL